MRSHYLHKPEKMKMGVQTLGHITPTLIIKLASIAIHAEEMLSKQTHEFDIAAINSLLHNAEVRQFLDDPTNAALLPVKRK